MVTHKLIPVCGCFYASGRSKWIMWFQTVPLQFSERGFYSRGTELVCSLRVTELFFPFFVTRLLKIIVYSILLHCFSHFTFLWFVSPIVNLKLLFFHMNFDGFHMKYYFIFKVTAAFSWKVQGVFFSFFLIETCHMYTSASLIDLLSVSAFLEKCDDVEERKKNEPTWAGNNLCSSKHLQGGTKILGKICENTLDCYTRHSIGKALGHKTWSVCMRVLEQRCLSRGLVLC